MERKVRERAMPGTGNRIGTCLVACLLLLAFGCAQPRVVTAAETPNVQRSTLPFKRCIGYWPTSYDDAYQRQAFGILKSGAQIACIQIDDWADPDDNKQKKQVLDAWLDRARKEGMQTYIAIEPFNGDRTAVRLPKGWKGPAPNVGDKKWQELYRSYILGLVKRHRPDYLNPAVESNMYYGNHPEDWENFRAFFSSLYREVKAVNAATRVFSSYQYEVLRGEFAGKKSSPQWELFDRKALQQDLVSITTYPNFLKPPYDADGVPADYFQDLKGRSKLPLFVAEVGFYSGGDIRPASTPNNQARFIRRLPDLFAGLNVDTVCWINIADLPDIPALAPLKKILPQFFSLGLFDDRLKAKPSWDAWMTMKSGATGKASPLLKKVSAGQAAQAAPPAQAAPAIDLAAFLGLGSTLSADVKGSAGAQELVWRYRFSTDPLAMLVHPSVSLPKTAQGLDVRLRSQQQTTVAVVLEESGGARYEARLTLPAGTDGAHRLPWENFTLQKETRDKDNRLDVDQVTKMVLLDLSGFFGKKGENEIRINGLQAIAQ